MAESTFDPESILAGLERERVRYVIIGGLAAVLYGSPIFTQDADICPARDESNLERLAKALREMDARIRTDEIPEGLPFACDPQFFAGIELVNLVTKFGPLDVSFTPAGTRGYDDLAARAKGLEIAPDLTPHVADLEDVIRSKEAANRPKDIAALPTLRTLLAEIRRRERKSE